MKIPRWLLCGVMEHLPTNLFQIARLLLAIFFFFDYEHHQSFTLGRKLDLTSRAPGQLESDVAQVQIAVIDLNEPPILCQMYMVNTEISLQSSTYNVDVNRGTINTF